jgi:hypothetical protein
VNDPDASLQDLFRTTSEQAPAYDERKLDRALAAPDRAVDLVAPRPRRPALLAAAAAVVLMGAAGATWWGIARHDGGTQSSSCASQLDFGGRTYAPDGALRHLPRTGESLGKGTQPGCDDGGGASSSETFTVYRIPGLAVGTAILARDMVWVDASLPGLPDEVAAMNRPLRCTSPDPTTISGKLVGYKGDTGDSATPPYSLEVSADEGDALPLDRYAVVSLRLGVTTETEGSTDLAFVRSALSSGKRVTATVTCSGGRWEALAIH